MNGEALSFKSRDYSRSSQPSPNFNPPQPESICAPVDLTAACEVEGFHAFNRARAKALIAKTARAMRAEVA